MRTICRFLLARVPTRAIFIHMKTTKALMIRNLEATIAELCARHETADRVTRRQIERQVKGAREEIRELCN